MQKWRPYLKIFPPLHSNPHPPPSAFRPRLFFSSSDSPKHPTANNSNLLPIHPRNRASVKSEPYPIPSQWHVRSFPRSICYHCGRVSYLVKSCRSPFKYYKCGVLGHKRVNCPTTRLVTSPLCPYEMSKEGDEILHRERLLDSLNGLIVCL